MNFFAISILAIFICSPLFMLYIVKPRNCNSYVLDGMRNRNGNSNNNQSANADNIKIDFSEYLVHKND